MKKLGIITFHCAENYGAFLQAYALQNWLKGIVPKDCKVEIIDYRPDYLINPYKIKFNKPDNANFSTIMKAFLIHIYTIPSKLRRHIEFKRQLKLLDLTNECYTTSNFTVSNEFNMLVLGSDQIWNPDITEGVDRVYYGKVTENKCLCVAYAASLGTSDFSNENKKTITMLLKDLDYIGVREKSSLNLLKDICRRDINVNCDPTLLIDKEVWNKLLYRVKENNYILVYNLNNNDILMDAYKIAKETGKKILHFKEPSIRPIFSDVEIKSVFCSGPIEFINYINSADLVLTDSFHATCFSLIFNKQFFSYLNKIRSERLTDLADIGDFRNRLIAYNNRITDEQISMLYSPVQERIIEKFNKLQEESRNYLLTTLNL